MRNKLKKQKGFTLIEMMVAVSIFVLVAFTITTVFVSAFSAYRKAQAMKRVMDNLSFAVDTIVLNLREGNNIDKVANVLSLTNSSGESLGYTLENGRLKETVQGQNLTSDEITVTDFEVQVIGEGRKLVKITLKGEAGSREMEKTSFKVETSVAQRNSDSN